MALNTIPGPDCDSLASVAEADLYHESRGNLGAWSVLGTEEKEVLLRRAYDYLTALYGGQWPAGVAFGDQGGTVPKAMRNACAILAFKAKDGDLMPEQEAQVLEDTVGPITTKYAERQGDGVRRFPEVDRLVGPLLAPAPSAYMATLIRT